MLRGVILALPMMIITLTDGKANGQTILAHPDAARIVRIENLSATPALVSGIVVNNTPNIIRDIELLIKFHWLWANEFKPGPDSPGRVVSFKLDKELAAGQSTPFRYIPDPPLSTRGDGQYAPEVTVASFTTVIPGGR